MLSVSDKRIKFLHKQLTNNIFGWYQEDIYIDKNILITLEFENKEHNQSSLIKGVLYILFYSTEDRKLQELVLFKNQSISHYVDQLNLEILKIKRNFKNTLDN